ncbi:uncharacterized protein LOC126836795 [Adelges cooleyi]|uniref:uncharacterized protein LOC126836795 n=1 Tax=Adelges cooleyi TaxID=133065 RepID=UPI00217FE432|nr:uncharacterized protein LOC126836795 [Adelges cooleyi]
MIVFSAEYVPEIKWNVTEPIYGDGEDVKNKLHREAPKLHKEKPTKATDRTGSAGCRLITEYIIKSIDQMIEHNQMCFAILEKRTRQQDLEIQVLTNILRNLYGDGKCPRSS